MNTTCKVLVRVYSKSIFSIRKADPEKDYETEAASGEQNAAEDSDCVVEWRIGLAQCDPSHQVREVHARALRRRARRAAVRGGSRAHQRERTVRRELSRGD